MALSAAEKQRRYRDKRDADPERRDKWLTYQKIKYMKDKRKGKRKLVRDMNNREHQMAKKLWKKYQRGSREREADVKNVSTPPSSVAGPRGHRRLKPGSLPTDFMPCKFVIVETSTPRNPTEMLESCNLAETQDELSNSAETKSASEPLPVPGVSSTDETSVFGVWSSKVQPRLAWHHRSIMANIKPKQRSKGISVKPPRIQVKSVGIQCDLCDLHTYNTAPSQHLQQDCSL